MSQLLSRLTKTFSDIQQVPDLGGGSIIGISTSYPKCKRTLLRRRQGMLSNAELATVSLPSMPSGLLLVIFADFPALR